MSTGKDLYVSVSDAAGILGISRQRVLQLIELGKLKADKIANVYLVPRSDLAILKREDRKPGRPPKAEIAKGKTSPARKKGSRR